MGAGVTAGGTRVAFGAGGAMQPRVSARSATGGVGAVRARATGVGVWAGPGRRVTRCKGAGAGGKGFAGDRKGKTKAEMLLEDGWRRVCESGDVAGEGQVSRPLLIGKDEIYCVARVGGDLRAFWGRDHAKFPLFDAKVFVDKVPGEGPSLQSPFDGSRYSLDDGRCLEWCPQGPSPAWWLVGQIYKGYTPPSLGIYPAQELDGGVWVKRR